MKPSISPITMSALKEAQRRLLKACARSTDGRLTVANLAREAGVSRATAYRASGLIVEFRSIVQNRRDPARPRYRSHRDHIAALEAQIGALKRGERKEVLALRRQIEMLAQHIQALTLLTVDQRRVIQSLEGSHRRVSHLGGTAYAIP